MLFRTATTVRPGWVAIATMGTRACAAYLERPAEGLPRVHWIEHLPWTDAEAGLRQLRRDHDLHQHATMAVLPRTQYHLASMESPELPREEWRDAIRWKLADMVDFPVDTASIDLLEVPANASQRSRPTVIAVAAAQAPLSALTLAAHKAKVRWSAFDIVECALRNLTTLDESAQRGQALLHIGSEASTLVVTASGELLVSRTIDVGLSQILPKPNDPNGYDTFQMAADRIGLEIQRTLDSVERQFTEVSVARIVVAPGGLDAFIGHITNLVYVPVEGLTIGDHFDLTGIDPMSSPAQEADAWLVLGAALRTQ